MPYRSSADCITNTSSRLPARDSILADYSGLVCEREARDTEALFGFVKANQATHSVREMCRLLKISKSGFYAWERRPMPARARADLGLTAKIHEIHRRSRGVYGAPNIHAELRTSTASGWAVNAWRASCVRRGFAA